MVRAGGGADAGDRAPAAERGWELAGARLTGVPGLEMRCSLAWERASGTCNPPMWVVRVCGGYGGARSEGDGSAVVEFAGAGRSCREGGLRPSGLALKGRAAALVLTEGSR